MRQRTGSRHVFGAQHVLQDFGSLDAWRPRGEASWAVTVRLLDRRGASRWVTLTLAAYGGGTTRPDGHAQAQARHCADRVAAFLQRGVGFRTTLLHRAGAWHIALGPRSMSGWALQHGQPVAVVVWREGPQAWQLAADITDALAANPEAQAAFDGLATFYRKAWPRWIEATKRRPEVRAARIAEIVRQVEAGRRERS